MNKKEIFKQLRIYDKVIQNCQVDYSNALPYYKVTVELENIYKLLNFKGCNQAFDNYIKKECLDYITESIKMSNKKIPEHLAKIEKERAWYMEFTLKELKHTYYQCGRYVEYAYHYYCPNET